MKKVFSIIMFLMLGINCNAQQESLFVIKDSTVEKDSKQVQERYTAAKKDFLFEDDIYEVRKTCSGEWGGSIWFKNKKTGIEYTSAATCPVVVNKLDGKYIVTNTLGHLYGFSEVIEISNPERMEKVKPLRTKGKKGAIVVRAIGDDETKSRIGVKQLVDSAGVLTIASFPYRNQLYHIITDFSNTFISTVVNGKFVTVDTVFKGSLSTHNPEVIRSHDGHFIIFFKNKNVKGYLDIVDNQINLYRFKE